jgi:hypothetical protein
MTISGFEPVTFQLVAHGLNHLRYRVPSKILWLKIKGLQTTSPVPLTYNEGLHLR